MWMRPPGYDAKAKMDLGNLWRPIQAGFGTLSECGRFPLVNKRLADDTIVMRYPRHQWPIDESD